MFEPEQFLGKITQKYIIFVRLVLAQRLKNKKMTKFNDNFTAKDLI